jgi:hypothetical protein
VPVEPDNQSIKAKFGVTLPGTAGVNAAFKELSAFIKNEGLANQSDVIKPGDWIDLDGGLQIAAYDDKGFDSNKVPNWNTLLTPESQGTLSRLIVVGINSFKELNGNGTTPHVVFQFQNIPHHHLMSTEYDSSSEGGYPDSHMLEYLREYFLPGLITAGVPDEVLWEPARMVSTRIMGGNGDLAQIKEKLWLPTAWEMLGTNSTYVHGEAAANQTQLAYYNSQGRRVKFDKSDAATPYWLASTTMSSEAAFAAVGNDGGVLVKVGSTVSAGNAIGVSPAFCVQGWPQP